MENIKKQLDECLLLTSRQAEDHKEDETYYGMLHDFIVELKELVQTSASYFETHLGAKGYKQSLQACLEDIIEDFKELVEVDLASAKKRKIYELLDGDVAELEDWIEDMNEVAETLHLTYLSSWDIGYFF